MPVLSPLNLSQEKNVDDAIDDVVQEQEERRSHDRSRLIVDVFFDGRDATGIASTKDISVGGLYMNTQADIPAGCLLLIRICER
jgi:hypothetical protein